MTRYPNLLELHGHHPYGEPAICDHAGIEPELLHAVLENGEPLLSAEIRGIAGLYGVPCGLLECPKLVMLDVNSRKVIAEVDNLYIRLKCMAREGNQEAGTYLEWADRKHQQFMRAAHANRLSYCHYLGIKALLSHYISFSTPRPKRRGYKAAETKKGGATV